MSTPPWPPDFLNAHERHWRDGDMLYREKRWANADHLLGLAAECGLKAIMEKLGMAIKSTGRPEKPYDKHVDTLWGLFVTFAEGRDEAQYAARLSGSDDFDNWSVSQRYAHEAQFLEAAVQAHHKAARKVRDLVTEVKTDGRMQ